MLCHISNSPTALPAGVSRCHSDAWIAAASATATEKGASGVAGGTAALIAEGASGVGFAVMPQTAIYVAGNAIVIAGGIVLAAGSAKTLVKDEYLLLMAQEEARQGVESAEPEGGAETNNKITTSEHAEIRGSQGRNVNTAINDLNKVKPSNVYLQDDGRYVIKGSNGRVHIMEPDGEIVTTMNNVTNFNKRVSSGRYVPLTEEQKADFAKKFSSYLNNAWSSYK